MSAFRITLVSMTAFIGIFTLFAVADSGFDKFTPFLRPILDMTWQGQFNIDFSCYFVLSGIWMAWRSGFTRSGLILGVCAPPLGILFFAPYLVYLIKQCDGDPHKLLLGVHSRGNN